MQNKNFMMNHLKQLREKKGITQIKLSTEIEVSQELISHFENGTSKPNIDNLIKLANYFNCSTDYLLNRTEVPTMMSVNSADISNNELLNKYNLLSDDLKSELEHYLEYLLTQNK